MSKIKQILKIAFFLLLAFNPISAIYGQSKNDLNKEDLLSAMRKASDYMANTVSYRGGYLHDYSEDLSEVFGEIPARKTMIWVQSATPQMGDLFLSLYKATGDKVYLDYAKRAADALIFGQHPLGGWHYFIDFDRTGLKEWYEKVASQFIRGYEEFRFYYGNCTFDDDVTQGATAFLLHLYKVTLDPTYFEPLKKALNFMLIAQYPNGGWPQRFPLRYDYAHDGFDDYTSNYTLNDDAMNNTINILIEAYEELGNEEYLEAARRGGDFFIISQGPEQLPAWSEQYDMNIQPDWARTHEPPAFGTRQTAHTVEMLMKLFLFTGDRRYLRPIPATLKWMESSKLQALENGVYEMARYYDPKTNFPVDYEILKEKSREGYITYRYFANNQVPFPGRKQNVDFQRLKNEFELYSHIEPGKEKEMYRMIYKKPATFPKPDNKAILQILNSRNEKGIWIENVSVQDVKLTMLKDDNRKEIKGISIKTFMNNMSRLMRAIQYFKQ
ncbi:MAG: pectate lyase [Prolixibacteraceae bacterium]